MCDKGGHPLTAGQADKERLSWDEVASLQPVPSLVLNLSPFGGNLSMGARIYLAGCLARFPTIPRRGCPSFGLGLQWLGLA